jgi:pilus assembly protein FimV
VSKFQLKKIAFTLSLGLSLGAAITAHAAGLGTMTSTSKLGEPLNAEIELLAVTPGELNSIQAALASDQVYQDQMLEKPVSYPYIQIAVANNNKGQPVLKLSSSQPITEAFLDMLIQVDWPTGRLVKEYTLLLDPPGFNSNYVSESNGLPLAAQPTPTPETIKAEPAVKADTEQPQASKPSTKKTSPVKQPPVQATKQEDPEASVPESLTTERGDTLYGIAKQMKPDNVSMEQMLAALYQTNKDAFDGKNMNRLKVGKIIRLPDQAALESTDRQQSVSLVAEHAASWQAYKNGLANAVKNADASGRTGNTQQSAGKIGTAQDKPAPQAPAGKDVLKLSAGDEKSTSQTDKAAAKNAAQEEAIAKENAIKEEQARAAALEKQVADMKKLMEMKNNAMAQAEKNAAQAQAEEPKAEQPPAEKAAETPAVSAEQPAAPAAEEKPAAPVEKVAPAPKAEIPAAEAQREVEQPSFMKILLDRLKGISPVLPWALIALPILICVWALIRIRRKKQIDTFEDAIVTSPATEMQNNTVFGDTQATSGDTSFLTDFSQSGVGGMIDSHDVDPIAEAEVYMAYGRDAQAEEILKDAIQKDPERQELKLKLLEIYQSTGNKGSFESLASEIYSNVAPSDPTWSKVVAMGQKLDPENSLYQMAPSDSSQAAAVAEAQNEEEGYHFNFEAPALEFDSSDSPEKSNDGRVDTAKDDVNESAVENFAALEPSVAESSIEQESDLPDLSESLADLEMPDLAKAEQPTSGADQLQDIDLDLDSAFAPEEANSEPEFSADVDSELTPKALDLPSLNLDEGIGSNEKNFQNRPSTTGEQNLASDDAVFESLPELSLELGGPNDIISKSSIEEPLDIEEISLGDPDDALSDESANSLSTADITEFPEISLDVAAKPEESSIELDDEPEEVNTKLDLIQAYIDMEDVIGAKELIEEVLSEGGERQRQRANELLAKVA